MRKKKNRFLLFLCSWIPGAGEMYLGFMKRGVSLLGLFIVGMMIAIFTNLGVLALLPMIVYAYSFFEANNLGALGDEEFYKVEDKYLFGLDEKELGSVKDSLLGKYRKGVAVILILLGINLLWDVVCGILRDIFYDYAFYTYIYQITSAIGNAATKTAIGVIIIWLGVKLVQGKKVELEEKEKTGDDENGE
ncbi:MAG: hypothetical protein PUD93_10205 [Lachnospiraceae bacterium]|nr:hypothetical protein [Lachnospiraceae bacterium]